MKEYVIHTRNQAGTTNYYLGSFKTKQAATEHAKKNYKWFNYGKYDVMVQSSWVNHFMARNQEKADEIAELKKRS